MTSVAPVVTLSPRDYDAVLFDLDGVLPKPQASMQRRAGLNYLSATAYQQPVAAFKLYAANRQRMR